MILRVPLWAGRFPKVKLFNDNHPFHPSQSSKNPEMRCGFKSDPQRFESQPLTFFSIAPFTKVHEGQFLSNFDALLVYRLLTLELFSKYFRKNNILRINLSINLLKIELCPNVLLTSRYRSPKFKGKFFKICTHWLRYKSLYTFSPDRMYKFCFAPG